MIKAVLFDLDRTLLDRDASVKIFAHRQYDRLGDQLQHIPRDAYVAKFIKLDERGYVPKNQLYQQLVQDFAITELRWKDLYHDFRANFSYCCRPFPGTEKVLVQLQQAGLSLGLITNGSGYQMVNIRALGIEVYFDVILISAWEGVRKPEAEIFQRALDRLEVSAEESVFVGDNLVADIGGAKQLGMKTIWKRDPFQEVDVVADGVIDDLREIPAMIGQFQ